MIQIKISTSESIQYTECLTAMEVYGELFTKVILQLIQNNLQRKIPGNQENISEKIPQEKRKIKKNLLKEKRRQKI